MTRARLEELKRNKLGLHPVSSELLAFVDKLLPVVRAASKRVHMVGCPACWSEAECLCMVGVAQRIVEALQESK